MLKARGVSDINSLQSQVPSLSFADYGNVKFVNIRGVGISEGAPNQSVGVAIH
jgi:iron complex outermembrane receptor protein